MSDSGFPHCDCPACEICYHLPAWAFLPRDRDSLKNPAVPGSGHLALVYLSNKNLRSCSVRLLWGHEGLRQMSMGCLGHMPRAHPASVFHSLGPDL